MELGKIICQYRKEHDLSQRDFAKLSGISNSYIAMLENVYDKRNTKEIAPTLNVVKKIANAMNINVNELLNMIDDTCTIENISTNFSKKIKQLRLDLGWTQEYVANELQISVPALSRYESGMYEPKSLSIIRKFAQLYNVTADYLLELDSNVGKQIRTLRENANLTQSELADKLNIAKSSIGMYETNQRQPSLEVLSQIANYFNVSTDYLLCREKSANVTPGISTHTNIQIGDRIKHLRKDKGINQKDLANALHLSNSAIGMYETNQSMPSIDVIKNLAQYFGVSTDYLLDNTTYSFCLDDSLTKEDIEDIKRYIEFIKSKKRRG